MAIWNWGSKIESLKRTVNEKFLLFLILHLFYYSDWYLPALKMTKNPCFQKVDCYINLIASCKVKLEKFGAGGQEHFEKVCGKNLTKVACGRSSKKNLYVFSYQTWFLVINYSDCKFVGYLFNIIFSLLLFSKTCIR